MQINILAVYPRFPFSSPQGTLKDWAFRQIGVISRQIGRCFFRITRRICQPFRLDSVLVATLFLERKLNGTKKTRTKLPSHTRPRLFSLYTCSPFRGFHRIPKRKTFKIYDARSHTCDCICDLYWRENILAPWFPYISFLFFFSRHFFFYWLEKLLLTAL